MNTWFLITGLARRWHCTSLVVVVLTLQGCATGPQPESPESAGPVESCQRWYADLDRLVHRSGVSDAQDSRIEGFPAAAVAMDGVVPK